MLQHEKYSTLTFIVTICQASNKTTYQDLKVAQKCSGRGKCFYFYGLTGISQAFLPYRHYPFHTSFSLTVFAVYVSYRKIVLYVDKYYRQTVC